MGEKGRDILEKTLDLVISGSGVGFINLCNHSDESRIDKAFQMDPESPLVVVGLDKEEDIKKNNSKLRVVFSRPKTAYVRVPCDLKVLKETAQRIQLVSIKASEALEAKAKAEEFAKQVRYLRHGNLDRGIAGDPQKIGKEARSRYGWTGSDEEIMARLQNFQPEKEMALRFSGQIIHGVFCDVEGTLLDWFGKIRPEIAGMLEKYAGEGKSVTLWSGGDPKKIQQKLEEAGVRWPLLSKDDFHGCLVEVAIDDLPQEKFLKDYGIKAEAYIQHDPDGAWLGKG